jgi:hypothetical protein
MSTDGSSHLLVRKSHLKPTRLVKYNLNICCFKMRETPPEMMMSACFLAVLAVASTGVAAKHLGPSPHNVSNPTLPGEEFNDACIFSSYEGILNQPSLVYELRRNSCVKARHQGADSDVADMPVPAFWQYSQGLTYGQVTQVSCVATQIREASTCAALCSKDAICSSFAFSFIERVCFLLGDARLSMCDPQQDKDSASCSAKNKDLLDQLSATSSAVPSSSSSSCSSIVSASTRSPQPSSSPQCRHCVFYQQDLIDDEGPYYCGNSPSEAKRSPRRFDYLKTSTGLKF